MEKRPEPPRHYDRPPTSAEIGEWQRELRAYVERLRDRYGPIYEDLVVILAKHDPIGIARVSEREYEQEAQTIVPRLPEARSERDLRRIVYEEFARWFGSDTVGSKKRYGGITHDLWDVWTKWREQSRP